jgi:formylmethanofuran dehydrogenase subunit E
LSGGRYQFNTFYVENNMEGMYLVQRIDNQKTVLVKRKTGVKPAIIDQMGAKASIGELTACELDSLKNQEDAYSTKLLQSNPLELFELQEIKNFQWKSPLKKQFIKTDIVNKNMIKCK